MMISHPTIQLVARNEFCSCCSHRGAVHHWHLSRTPTLANANRFGCRSVGEWSQRHYLATGARQGTAPFVGGVSDSFTDPVPQALVLTAIVIGFALTAFLVALAWRSWTIDGNDLVEDDVEDRLATRRTEADHLSNTPAHEDVDISLNGEDSQS